MTATLDRTLVAPARPDDAFLRFPPLKAASPAPSIGRPHRIGWWLVALVAFGAVLRLWGLGASRFSYDEAFTAMAGRLPVGDLFGFLTRHDSHPPLDYLLHLPLARAGASEFWFRLPSALLSIGALALLAWWLRSRGRVAVVATTLMAVSTFQISHGRQARMYAELEFIGVAIAVLTSAWLARPRRLHAVLLGLLVFAGLLTHVSMFLLAAGLLVVPGRRTDRAAWQWRAAIAAGGFGWAALWGTHFLVQAQGGHSSWIPSTTPATLVTAISRLLTFEPTLAVPAVLAIGAGSFMLARRDRQLGRVWVCCFAVPVTIAAIAGLSNPVVLDRTFTLMAWAPAVAVAFLLDAASRNNRIVGSLTFMALAAFLMPSSLNAITTPSGPDTPLRALEQRVRPGDIVAVRPASKAPELQWSLGVQTHSSTNAVPVPGLVNVAGAPRAFGIRVGSGPTSGRVWILDWKSRHSPALAGAAQCRPSWGWGHVRIRCLETGSDARNPIDAR